MATALGSRGHGVVDATEPEDARQEAALSKFSPLLVAHGAVLSQSLRYNFTLEFSSGLAVIESTLPGKGRDLRNLVIGTRSAA